MKLPSLSLITSLTFVLPFNAHAEEGCSAAAAGRQAAPLFQRQAERAETSFISQLQFCGGGGDADDEWTGDTHREREGGGWERAASSCKNLQIIRIIERASFPGSVAQTRQSDVKTDRAGETAERKEGSMVHAVKPCSMKGRKGSVA